MYPLGEGWDPPEDICGNPDFHWFKVPSRGSLVLVMLGTGPVWYTGHFTDGRMWPCSGEECELCKRGIGAQLRYVVACCEPVSRKVGMLEIGKNHGLQLKDWCGRAAGFKGMMVEFSKHSAARQSRTEMVFVDQAPPVWVFELEAPDIARALILTWRKAEMPVPQAVQEKAGELSLADNRSGS